MRHTERNREIISDSEILAREIHTESGRENSGREGRDGRDEVGKVVNAPIASRFVTRCCFQLSGHVVVDAEW